MTMANKFLIIDGNSLLFRAYHALPPLTSSSGQPTGALLGFAEMLLNLLDQEKPDAAAIVFDASGPTFRHEQFAEYKANRPPTPDDLQQQIALAHDIAQALGLKLFEVPGVEADDVIATLARQGRDKGAEVLIVSGDRDLVQLVQPGISVLASVRGFSDTRLYDEQRVEEEFGVSPQQLPDLKGLAGDASDNIPGAPGVGPKTAQRLLRQYGSIEGIYSHLDSVQPPRIAEALRNSREQVELGAKLAKVLDDVDLPAGPDDCAWHGVRVSDLRRLFVQLEFNKLLPRLPQSEEFSTLSVRVAASPQDIRQFVGDRGHPIALAAALADDQPVGVALCRGDHALYVTLSRGGHASLFDTSSPPDLSTSLAETLADPQLPKVGYDLKSLAADLEQAGIRLDGLAFDVALAGYLLAPQRGPQGLDALTAMYLGTGPPPPDVTDPDADAQTIAGPVAARAAAAWRLREPLEDALRSEGLDTLFYDVEMPLVGILRDMERAGISIDTDRLGRLGQQLSQLASDLSHRIYDLAGHEFNIDSPKQLAKVLFEEMNLPHRRRTKTGYSTSAAVLAELAEEHEIARLILEYREYAKLKSTYVDGLLKLVDTDGRIRTTFEQMVTATGRLSSRNPNLQNIPIRTEWGREIRACFVAPADDWLLLSADYSQIELRILAHLSQDPQLVEAFARGEDIHRRTAALIFDVPPNQVDADMRRVAKTVNYALIYGQGPNALAQQIGTTRAQAEEFIRNYFRRLPRVKEYLERTIQQARENLYVETIFGRRRPLPEILSTDNRTRSYAERAATNAPIQGSAADIIKIAMVRLAQRLANDGSRARLLLQVHDELVLETPAAEAAELGACVKEVMEQAADLSVPLTVDLKAGPNWRDMEKL